MNPTSTTVPYKGFTAAEGPATVTTTMLNPPTVSSTAPTSAPKVSTTTISNQNKVQQVPGMVNTLNTMSQGRGMTTDGTTTRFADGTIAQDNYREPTLPPNSSPIYGTVNGQGNRIIGYNSSNLATGQQVPTYFDSGTSTPAYSPEEQQFNDIMAQIKSTTDAQTASKIASIQNKFETLRAQQKEINRAQQAGIQTALLTGGVTGKGSSAQYTPISSEGIVASQLNYGLQKIAELDSQELDLINEAKDAQASQNFQLLEKKLAQVESKREEKAKQTAELNKKIAEQNKKAREKLIQSTRDNALADIYSQGITDPTEMLAALNATGGDFTLKEINEGLDNIAKANGTTTSKMSQDVAEFYALKKEKGGLPVSILGLSSTAEQIAAYLKLKTQSETKGKATVSVGGGTGNVPIVDGKMLEYEDPAYTLTVIRQSKGKKELTGEQSKPIQKALQAISQVDAVAESLVGQSTGPIWGAIRSANPYDVKAQIIKGQLQALIPNLARGVYGEVGVLTDADIENYSKTLGNLKSQKEVNDALIAITQKAAFNAIKTNLEGMAASGRDVSGFEAIYKNVQKNIEAKLPKTSFVGGSTAQDMLSAPLPGAEQKIYSPSVWNLFK